jgi:hypothetical protein
MSLIQTGNIKHEHPNSKEHAERYEVGGQEFLTGHSESSKIEGKPERNYEYREVAEEKRESATAF